VVIIQTQKYHSVVVAVALAWSSHRVMSRSRLSPFSLPQLWWIYMPVQSPLQSPFQVIWLNIGWNSKSPHCAQAIAARRIQPACIHSQPTNVAVGPHTFQRMSKSSLWHDTGVPMNGLQMHTLALSWELHVCDANINEIIRWAGEWLDRVLVIDREAC